MRTVVNVLRPFSALRRRQSINGRIVRWHAGRAVTASAHPPGRSLQKTIRRRCLAPLTAVCVVAGCIAVVNSQPASAQTSQTAQAAHATAPFAVPTTPEQICLSSSTGACVGFPVQDVISDTIAAAGVAAAWVAIFFKWISAGSGDGGQEGEEKDVGAAGDGDPDAGLCLATTDPNPVDGDTTNVYMTTCGAQGTVWIALPNGNPNEYYLESRWWYNQGVPSMVLSTNSPAHGSRIFVNPILDNDWRTWSYFSTTHT